MHTVRRRPLVRRHRAPPVENVAYRAQAATKERVEEILSWIRIVPGLVAVPGHEQADLGHQDDDAGEHYRAELKAARLEVEVRNGRSWEAVGPGTSMLTLTIAVNGEPVTLGTVTVVVR